jgi:hypothetical protein
MPICLKGYAFPPNALRAPLTQFYLTADGDGDMDKPILGLIVVELPQGQEWQWRREPIAVSGKLVRSEAKRAGFSETHYRLINATIRPSRTRFMLAERSRRGC